jgi:hypothetical protein
MLFKLYKRFHRKLRTLNKGFSGGFKYNESNKITKITNKLNSNLKSYCNDINLPSHWSESDALDIEVKKCTIRAVLRFSNSGIQLAKLVANHLQKDVQLQCYTPIYPMLHLPGDHLEVGSMHIDQIREFKMLTAWTPITEYYYAGLSFYNFSSKYTALLTYFNSKYLKFLESTLKIKQGTTISWGATFPHRGNLNTSNNYSCACVIRISEEPLIYEPHRNSNDDAGEEKIASLTDSFDIKEIYSRLLLCIEFSKKHYNKTVTDEFLEEAFKFKKLNSMDPDIDKILSFALSVLAQRIEKKVSTLKNNNNSINTSILTILSLLYGPQNLSFLSALMNKIHQQKNGKKIFKKLESYLTEFTAFNSLNWENITGKNDKKNLYWKF